MNCGIEKFEVDPNLLKRIEVLDLRQNKLSDLPHYLESLENLTHIYLNKNEFCYIPSCLLKMKKLQILTLEGNPIIDADILKFGNDFGKLKNFLIQKKQDIKNEIQKSKGTMPLEGIKVKTN